MGAYTTEAYTIGTLYGWEPIRREPIRREPILWEAILWEPIRLGAYTRWENILWEPILCEPELWEPIRLGASPIGSLYYGGAYTM